MMMRARSLLNLGLVLASIGVLTTSCGSDEATKDDDGDSRAGNSSAGQSNGGSSSGGRAGGAGRGNVAGQPGGGTAGGGPTSATDLGEACVEGSTTCGALECQVWLDIPGGICTAECTEDAECRALGPNGACLSGICFEGCSPSALGTRCHNRDDMVCQPYRLVEGAACQSDVSCAIGESCLGGTCVLPLTACLPSCDSDSDCEGGFCDLRTGSCSAEDREGLPIGAECDPDVAEENDPCEGFCVGSGDGVGFCSGWCRWSLAPACGYEADAEYAEAACLWSSAIQPDANEGEAGFCGQLCDCDADCRHPDFKCAAFPQSGETTTFYGRRGLCAQLEPGETSITECEDTGGAGAGGAGAGGASAGGAGGEAGSDTAGTSGAGAGGAPSEGGAAGSQ